MPVNSYCMFKDVGEESLTSLILLGTIILVVLVSFVIMLSYFFTTRKNKLLKEKELLHAQFQQQLLQTQLEIQEQTLKTISEEIHDNIGQVLSLAKLNLNTLPNSDEPKIQDTKNLVSKAITDLRNLSHSMHGDIISELGLQQSIANELRIIESTKAFVTELKNTGTVFKLNAQKEMVLFRMVQEALHNIVKHSAAATITVGMQYQPQAFTLTVTDDGKGFDPSIVSSSNGLKNIKARALALGGIATIVSEKNAGTVVTVKIPAT